MRPLERVAPDTPEEARVILGSLRALMASLIKYKVALLGLGLRGYTWVHACYDPLLRIGPQKGPLSSRLERKDCSRLPGSLLPGGQVLPGSARCSRLVSSQLP